MTDHDHRLPDGLLAEKAAPDSCCAATDKTLASDGAPTERASAEALTAIDPVCGMTVAKATAKHVATFERESFYFCSVGCRAKFVADPAKLAKPQTEGHACGCGGHEDRVGSHRQHAHDHPHGSAVAPANLVKDPVCGMDVDPVTAKFRSEQEGQAHYFCSGGCRDKFDANPKLYPADDQATPATTAPVPEGTIYTSFRGGKPARPMRRRPRSGGSCR